MSPAGSRRARHIIAEEATAANLKYEDVLRPSLIPEISGARHAAMQRMRSELNLPVSQIAELFGISPSAVYMALKRQRDRQNGS